MKDIQPNRCCHLIAYQGGFHFHQCYRTKNLIKRKDGFYCCQHDPIENNNKLQTKLAKIRAANTLREQADQKDKQIHRAADILFPVCREILETLKKWGYGAPLFISGPKLIEHRARLTKGLKMLEKTE